ncbi:MAG: hypothetical protein CL678_06625 [Bdellovibrionaceae bacterium]|nr:hypothetical protein [Pseudobdellovibrionaceae bacterium]|tara:strand:+ start:721 stop:1143 length:423 start_codon:yes stop_codon:yes gene_type:complete
MKRYFILSAILFSLSASAHLELGAYNGSNEKGLSCGMIVHSVDFKNEFIHPLNERVTIQWKDIVFDSMSHSELFDLAKYTIKADKSVFLDFYVDSEVTALLMVDMANEAPYSIKALELYANGQIEFTECNNLTYQGADFK